MPESFVVARKSSEIKRKWPVTLPQVHDDIFPIRLAVLVPLEIEAES